MWRAALATIGLAHTTCSWPPRPRRTVVLIATREPHERAEPLAVPWPETTLAVCTEGVTVHTAHVPNAANGWVKPDTLAALRAGLEKTSGAGGTVLCGDLNTPRREHPDGTVISFARDTKERLREERGERWDGAELGVVPGLRELGFADAFRALHGYERKEPSWVFRHGGGWRLDHVFCRPPSSRWPPAIATIGVTAGSATTRPWKSTSGGGRLAVDALARLLAGHRALAPAGLLGVVHQRAEELRSGAVPAARASRAGAAVVEHDLHVEVRHVDRAVARRRRAASGTTASGAGRRSGRTRARRARSRTAPRGRRRG
jgi:hypothetical protein